MAVAIVAHAIWGMARSLAWDRRLIAITIGAAALALVLEGSWSQIFVIGLGAVAGFLLMRRVETIPALHAAMPVSRKELARALPW